MEFKICNYTNNSVNILNTMMTLKFLLKNRCSYFPKTAHEAVCPFHYFIIYGKITTAVVCWVRLSLQCDFAGLRVFVKITTSSAILHKLSCVIIVAFFFFIYTFIINNPLKLNFYCCIDKMTISY